MIPLWAISAIGAAAVAGFAGWQYGTSVEGAKLERERTAWANAQAKALADQARDHNAKAKKLEGITDDTKRMLDASRAQANAADAVVVDGDRDRRRLRDALATSDLANRAALDAAGAAGQCAATLEAARVRGELLGRLDAAAGELEIAAAAVGRHADDAYGASVGCQRAYSVIRGSGDR